MEDEISGEAQGALPFFYCLDSYWQNVKASQSASPIPVLFSVAFAVCLLAVALGVPRAMHSFILWPLFFIAMLGTARHLWKMAPRNVGLSEWVTGGAIVLALTVLLLALRVVIYAIPDFEFRQIQENIQFAGFLFGAGLTVGLAVSVYVAIKGKSVRGRGHG